MIEEFVELRKRGYISEYEFLETCFKLMVTQAEHLPSEDRIRLILALLPRMSLADRLRLVQEVAAVGQGA